MSSYYQIGGGKKKPPTSPADAPGRTPSFNTSEVGTQITPDKSAATPGTPAATARTTTAGLGLPRAGVSASVVPPVQTAPISPALTGAETVTPPIEVEAPPDDDVGPGDEFQDRSDQMWDDLWAQWKNAGKNDAAIAQAMQASAGRRAAGINASLGRSVGGGFMGGMAQAALTGQQKRLELEQQRQTQGLELKMTYLQNLLKQAEASKDREQQIELQNMIDTTMLQLEAIRNGADVPLDLDGDGQPDVNTDVGDPGAPDASTWEGYRDLDPASQYTQTRQHANDELPAEGGHGDQSINSIRGVLEDYDFWEQATAEHRTAAANYMWGYYLREGKLPSWKTVAREGIAQGWWEEKGNTPA